MANLEIDNKINELNKRLYNIHNILTTEIISLPRAMFILNEIDAVNNELKVLIENCTTSNKEYIQKDLLSFLRRFLLYFVANTIHPILGLGALTYQLFRIIHPKNRVISVRKEKFDDTQKLLYRQTEYLGIKSLYYLNQLNPLNDPDNLKYFAAKLTINSLSLINDYIKTGKIKPEDELFIDSAIVILQYELDSDCNNIYELLELFKERYVACTAELLLKRTNQ